MPSISESVGQSSQLQTAFRAGLDAIDRDQTVTFRSYQKFVSPLDGYVYWIASGQTTVAKGSLHYGTDRHQDEDQTIGVNQIIFTAEAEITEFNSIAPGAMWIGTWLAATADPVVVDTDPLTSPYGQQINSAVALMVTFSRRGNYYEQANVWHYVGDAVYPAMAAQIVGSLAEIPVAPIVSNSLPIWLAQNSIAPVYPSYLVPDNVAPPYVVAHVEPSRTEALQDFPVFSWPGQITPGAQLVAPNGTPIDTQTNQPIYGTQGTAPLHNLPSYQLMRDQVRLTLYGFTNAMAIQYLCALEQYSLDSDAFGFMNMPAIRDEKRTQVEIAAIAMKKTIEIDASYYQTTADAIARRLILSAALTVNLPA